MKKTATFYIHIQSDTLAHYLVRGIFCPSRFLTNKNKDMQDQFDSFLILSDKKWNTESDCSIKIILLEEEIAKLFDLQKNYVALAGCLPISRLKMIYFADKKKAENVIWNINQGAAYVPEWAISFENKNKQESVSLTEKHSFPGDDNEGLLKTHLQRYDRLMGGFAFMRTAHLLKEYHQLDITRKSASAISYFNTEIAESVKNQNVKLDTNILNVFSGKDPIYSYLGKEITDEIITTVSKKENQKVTKQFNTIILDQLDQNSLTFELAMLFTYGKGKVKSDSDLVSGLFNNINVEFVEKLALVYGLNSGYKALRNAYSNANYTENIKFKLLTKLEFYLIESLYRYAFWNHTISNSFSFINDLEIKKNSIIKNDNFQYLRLFDSVYAYEKTKTKKDNKESLSSMIKQTVNKWCSTNAVELDVSGFDETLINKILPLIKENIIVKKVDYSSKTNNVKNDKEFKSRVDESKIEKQSLKNSIEDVLEKNSKKQPSGPLKLFDDTEQCSTKDSKDDDELSYKDLDNLKVTELKKLCKKKGYTNYSKLLKEDLIKFIMSQQ
ncbi:hypothetical protein ACFSQ0_05315 [Mesonia sediminis]|uniref:2-Component system ADP-ribosyltransferase domain-containing protein n=1 Tax=Mesonia sediminis TaxID=1703946 RepID=A0ABW5SFD4_9FLAO